MAKVKAKIVPLNERTFIIGDAELMGYTGCDTPATLKKYYFDMGLLPSSIKGKKKYYRRTMVDKFIEDTSDVNYAAIRKHSK